MTERMKQKFLLLQRKPLRAWSVSFADSGVSPDGVRADLAYGMVAEVAVGDATVRNDFDRISIFNRPIFNATWDSESCAWRDFTARGEEGFTFSPTEEGREVLYRCMPFWYRLVFSGDGELTFVSVSDRALDGYRLAPMFKDGSTPVYRPCFEMSYVNGVPHSRAGYVPFESFPTSVLASVGNQKASMHLERITDWFSDYLLLLVEFATKNLQGVLHGASKAPLTLFNASENNDCPQGLYAATAPDFAVGDAAALVYLNDAGIEQQMSVTVDAITYYDGIGYLLDIGIFDYDIFFNESIAWQLCCAKYKTGTALTAVTNASSGRSGENLCSPIVWRGKENPWGNVSSLIGDILVDNTEYGSMQFYHIADLSQYSSEICEAYQPCGNLLTGFEGTDMYVRSFALVDEPPFFVPAAFETEHPEWYWTTRVSMRDNGSDITRRFLAVGGNFRKEAGTNHATMELMGDEDAAWAYLSSFGGRLIMEEGVS